MLGIALTIAGVAAGGVFAHGMIAPASQLFGTAVFHGKNTRGVALTFDDGPHPDGTPAILDALEQAQCKATFFVIGAHAHRWPALVRRIVEAGHIVGNHSFSHSHFASCGHAGWWRDQIARTDRAVFDASGVTPTYFRPPLGLRPPPTMIAARQMGKTVVTWSRRAVDGVNTTSERIVGRLVPGARGGDIFLLHDGIDPHLARDPRATIEAIAPVIAGVRARGLGVVGLDELIRGDSAGDRAEQPHRDEKHER